MNDINDLLLIVTYTILFLFIFLIAIIIFIIKSRKDRIKIEEKKKEIEEIAKQKSVLLKEIHHRVKNNLQLISGLLYLQSVKYKETDVSKIINESLKHINSIALVHEMLYQDETLYLVSMEKYLKELGFRLLQVSSQENINYNLKALNIALPVNYATTLGLIFNELVTNSLKHAFTNKDAIVSVSLKKISKNEYVFMYSDNGKGFEFSKKDTTKKTLGTKLIKMLAEEIEANLSIENNNGLTYQFTFKIN